MKRNILKMGGVALASLLLMTTSCSNEEFQTEDELSVSHLPKNVLSKIQDLQMNADLFDYKEVTLFDGTSKKLVITGEDIALELNRFLTIPTNDAGLNVKQYRTEFSIDTDKFPTVDIIAFTGEGPFGLSQLAQDGLVAAVDNWNAIRSKIELTLTFTTNPNPDFSGFEIRVNTDSRINADGIAEFPDEDGNPGSFVLINSRVNAEFPDGFEHLLTHEIGHALGFRHTDWNSRQSCVDQGLEQETSVETNPPMLIYGSIPSIPGVLEQENSIMNACFNFRTTDGELNFFDRSGLKLLYPFYY